MTGFGRAEDRYKNYHLQVEIKSLNSKYFDLISKYDDSISAFENEITQLVKSKCERGKIFLNIKVVKLFEDKNKVKIDNNKVKHYMNKVNTLKKIVKTNQDVSLTHILNLPGIFIESNFFDRKSNKSKLFKSINNALSDLLKHRKKEGSNIEKDLIKKVTYINKKINLIDKKTKSNITFDLKNYNKRINKIVGNIDIDKDRVFQEIAIMIEKKAIDEEIIRIKSHLELLLSLIKNKYNTGKKINFILQEIHREINTIGSKSDNVKISHTVVELKSIIEKIKEQIQNIL